jgi:hypothetical protein
MITSRDWHAFSRETGSTFALGALERVPKSAKRFSDKNARQIRNLERVPKSAKRFSDKKARQIRNPEHVPDSE